MADQHDDELASMTSAERERHMHALLHDPVIVRMLTAGTRRNLMERLQAADEVELERAVDASSMTQAQRALRQAAAATAGDRQARQPRGLS